MSAPELFSQASAQVQALIEHRYAIRVITRDIPDPLTGDLSGSEIHVDYALTPEQRLFLLVHLFGHTVQWNVDPAAFELGQPRQVPVDESLLPGLMNYEIIAGRYGLSLLHEAGVRGLEQWLADYTACDRAYLAHYYRTAHRKEAQHFWIDGTPLLTPLPIPPFQPILRAFRTDGVVI